MSARRLRIRKPGSRAIVVVLVCGVIAAVAWVALCGYMMVPFERGEESPRAGTRLVLTRAETSYVRDGLYEYARDRRELDRWMHLREVDRRTGQPGKSARSTEELERYLAVRQVFEMLEFYVLRQRDVAAINAQHRRDWGREADRQWRDHKVIMPRR